LVKNCLANNFTNVTLLLALPAILWGLNLRSASGTRKARVQSKVDLLALMLTMVALLVFNALVWLLSMDGSLDQGDGMTLIAVFFFWQVFHVYEVMKEKIVLQKRWSPLIVLDLLVIFSGAWLSLICVNEMVAYLMHAQGGWLGPRTMGVFTGCLMVVPNAILALYYASRGAATTVYSSQVGDGHICIPLCLGLYASFVPIAMGPLARSGLIAISTVALLHLLCISAFRRLPTFVAFVLLACFAFGIWVLGG
jgi:cation:H+ antiporter